MDHHKYWEDLLTPDITRDRLISASLFITAFEILKDSIVGRVRNFFVPGWDIGEAEAADDTYKREVLSRNKSTLYASLHWLIEHGAVDSEDMSLFEVVKSTRNMLAHRMPALVLGGENFHHEQHFVVLVQLLRKIETWWIVNVEIPTDPQFDGREIDEEEIVPGPVLMLQMMQEVISGNEELLKHYRARAV